MEFEFFLLLLIFSLAFFGLAALLKSPVFGAFGAIGLILSGLVLLVDRVRVARVLANNTTYDTWSSPVSSILGILVFAGGLALALGAILSWEPKGE